MKKGITNDISHSLCGTCLKPGIFGSGEHAGGGVCLELSGDPGNTKMDSGCIQSPKYVLPGFLDKLFEVKGRYAGDELLV